MFSPLNTLTRFPDVHALISTTTILKHYIRDYPDYAPITFQEVVIVMIKSSTGTRNSHTQPKRSFEIVSGWVPMKLKFFKQF